MSFRRTVGVVVRRKAFRKMAFSRMGFPRLAFRRSVVVTVGIKGDALGGGEGRSFRDVGLYRFQD
jgi:hypothetical protein